MANFPNVIEPECIPTTPPAPNPLCADPAYALLHPDICAASPFLRLKPEVLIACVLGSVQFQAFYVVNGIETELTSGVVYTTNQPSVALVGVNSGNATGVASGVATITATYQGLTATARLTILPGLNCCEDNAVATMIVLDKSHSMSAEFGSGYITKQDFADQVAAAYANQVNTTKDTIGLVTFNRTPTTDEPLTTDKAAVAAAAAGTVVTDGLTTISDGIGMATEALLASPAPTKVMVLISDGVDNHLNPAQDPSVFAALFKNQGGIIIVVGVRAYGTGFNLLNSLSTGGFFINAYPSVVDEAIQAVYSLKGYVCGGNCVPPGNVFQNEPQLDYTAFLNWTVTLGHVDLIGPGLFDVLPGNGLYVSLVSNIAPYSGQLTSQSSFSFTAGKTYRLSFYVAGNQRIDNGSQSVTVKVGDGTPLMQVVGIPSYSQGFTKYSYNFTLLSDTSANISFTEIGNNLSGNYFGCILASILLEDVTDGTTLFTDNFDAENLQYIPPACGAVLVPTGGTPISDPSPPTLAPWGLSQVPSAGAGTIAKIISVGGHVGNDGNGWVGYLIFNTAEGHTDFPAALIASVPMGGGTNSVRLTMPGGLNPRITSITILRNATAVGGLGNYTRAIIPVSQTTYDDLLSTTEFFATVTDPNDIWSNSNTTGTSPAGAMDLSQHDYAVSYKTASGETKLSSTVSLVLSGDYTSIKITTPINPEPTVTSKRLWRFAAGAFRLLAELSPGTADYYDILSNAQFAAAYNPAIVAPTTNTTGGTGYFAYYGYNCYGYGCSSEPPGSQLQDPNPQPDIEAGFVPPVTYTGSASYTAKCPSGSGQIGPASSVPVMTSATAPAGIVTVSTETAGFEGWRAFGTGPSWLAGAGPAWLQYQFVTPQTIVAFAITPAQAIVLLPCKLSLQGSNDGIAWTTVSANIATIFTTTARVQFPVITPDIYLYYRLNIAVSTDNGNSYLAVPSITLLELLGVMTNGGGITKSSTATSTLSQSDANTKALASAQLQALTALALTGCATIYTSTQSFTAKCTVGYDGNGGQGVTKSVTATSFVSQAAADALALSQAQSAAESALSCTGSNNNEAITIPDQSPSTPYPSISYKSALPGLITRVRVNLLNYTSGSTGDTQLLLVSPAGKKVLLMRNCGTGFSLVSPINLTFDSASGTPLPAAAPITAGSYSPTSFGVGPDFPAPSPASPYLTSFVSLIGDSPNGVWSLWGQDIVSLDSSLIAGGWTLTLDTA